MVKNTAQKDVLVQHGQNVMSVQSQCKIGLKQVMERDFAPLNVLKVFYLLVIAAAFQCKNGMRTTMGYFVLTVVPKQSKNVKI
mgnify:CR=1 FL=1